MWERYTQPASVLQVPGTVGSSEDDGVSSGARQVPFSEGPASQAELPRLPTSPRPWGKFWCPQARCVPTAVCMALEPGGPARWSLSCQSGHLASCAVGHTFSLYPGFGAGAGQAQSGGGLSPSPSPGNRTRAHRVSSQQPQLSACRDCLSSTLSPAFFFLTKIY